MASLKNRILERDPRIQNIKEAVNNLAKKNFRLKRHMKKVTKLKNTLLNDNSRLKSCLTNSQPKSVKENNSNEKDQQQNRHIANIDKKIIGHDKKTDTLIKKETNKKRNKKVINMGKLKTSCPEIQNNDNIQPNAIKKNKKIRVSSRADINT